VGPEEGRRQRAEASRIVSFQAATTAFQDPLALLHDDPDHSDGEKREILVGHDALGRLLVVVFTEREDRIRIISARGATKHERKAYEASQKNSSQPH
jgi:uncharacterized DUF497 family protein